MMLTSHSRTSPMYFEILQASERYPFRVDRSMDLLASLTSRKRARKSRTLTVDPTAPPSSSKSTISWSRFFWACFSVFASAAWNVRTVSPV